MDARMGPRDIRVWEDTVALSVKLA
jgi:hypothetical protein